MAQVNGTENQTTTKATAANLFASLRSSFNVDGVKGGLFSSLLAQSKSADPLPVAVAPEQPATPPDNSPSSAPANAKTGRHAATKQNDDMSQVRAALRQVRDDIEAVRASRKRDDAAQAKATGDDKKADAANVDNAAPKPAQTDKPEDPAVPAKDIAAATPEAAPVKPDIIVAEVAPEPAVAIADAAPAEQQTETAKPDETSSGKDILADLLQTEQALMAMLQEMLQDKKVRAQAATGDAQTAKAENSAVETVKNGSDETAAKGKSDAVLAAALGGAASSADAAKPEADDALPDPVAEAQTPAASLAAKAGQDNAIITDKHAAKDKAVDIAAMFHPVSQDDATPVVAPNNAALTAALANGKAAEIAPEDNATARPLAATAANANAAQSPMHAEGSRPVGSYDFASQLSALRATKGGATGLPAAVEQVTLQLHKMAKLGADQMTLQLRPAELGRIEIKLEFAKDGSNGVKGIVIADTQAALDMLQKDSGGLQRALQDAGLRADSGSLQFNLRGDGQQNASAQNNDGQASAGNGRGGFAAANDGSEALAANAAEETYYITPGRVNLRV